MYEKITSRWGKHFDFILLDAAAFQLAFVLAYILRHGAGELPYSVPFYQRMALTLVLIEIVVVFFGEGYRGIMKRGYLQELKAVFKFVTIIVVLEVVFLFLTQNAVAFSRSVFIQLWALGIVILYLERSAMKKYLKRIRRSSNKRKVLVLTDKNAAADTLKTMTDNNFGQFEVAGIVFLDDTQTNGRFCNVPVVCGVENVLEYIRTHVVDEVFFSLPLGEALPESILQGCMDMGVTVHRKLFEAAEAIGTQSVEKFGGYTVLSSSIKIATTRQLILKRLMDIAGGLVGCVITGIAFIFVAPIIKIQSPGPVFFSQNRVGKNGRLFKIYKFRSMYTDAEARKKELMAQNKMQGLMFKMDNDPRIFPFGHVIRKFSIDELPQFWNVLKGDMSLVGTRPPTVDEYAQYELHHKRRLAAKPGLTGMWQASGRSDITDFEEVVRLDSYYIEHWTLAMDVKLILKTIQVVVAGRGSV